MVFVCLFKVQKNEDLLNFTELATRPGSCLVHDLEVHVMLQGPHVSMQRGGPLASGIL